MNAVLKVISVYLTAWEKVVDFSFAESSAKHAGAAIKIAGLRYMLLMLPAFWDEAISSRRRFDSTYVEEILKKLISSMGIEREHFFLENKAHFADRTATERFAKQSSQKIKAIDVENFNPLG